MISKKNIFGFQKKKEIYDFVYENPGMHLREISKKMNIPKTTLEYHLKYLTKYELIETKHMSKFKRYWVSNKISSKEKEILGLFRNENICNIILLIYNYVARSETDICKDLEMSPSKVNYYLKKLVKFDIIEEAPYKDGYILRIPKDYAIKRDRVSNEVFYRLKWPISVILLKIIIRYHKSFPYNPLIEFFVEIAPEKHAKNPLKNYKIFDYKKDDAFGKAIDALYELFPIPFCA